MANVYTQVVQTAKIDIIMREWAKGYKPLNDSQEIMSTEWYVDPVKGTVVFVLNMKEEE